MLSWLQILKGTPTGARLLSALGSATNGSLISIVYADPATREKFATPMFGVQAVSPWSCTSLKLEGIATNVSQDSNGELSFTRGKPAQAADILIGWDINMFFYKQITGADNPGAALIGHELVHALHYLLGENVKSVSAHDKLCSLETDNLEEARTIGRSESHFQYEELSENAIRNDLKAPLRGSHCSMVDPSKPQTVDGGAYAN
jgi:hypothetical protein